MASGGPAGLVGVFFLRGSGRAGVYFWGVWPSFCAGVVVATFASAVAPEAQLVICPTWFAESTLIFFSRQRVED